MRSSPSNFVRWAAGMAVALLATSITAQAQAGRVAVRVTDAANQQPVGQAQVQIVGTTLGGLTSTEGRFTIRGVPPGTHQVRVLRVGYGEQKKQITVTGDHGTTIETGNQTLDIPVGYQHYRIQGKQDFDIVGNTNGENGVHDNTTVRVFAEGTKAVETPAQANRRRYNGGEVDSPSRNLARFVARLAEHYVTNLEVRMVYRTDRYGRGGDQVPFLEAGFPAVRFSEAHENYTRQHQDLRVEHGVRYGDTIDGVDFPYLAQVTRLDAVALAALANAPAPPKGVAIEGAVTPHTTVKWQPASGVAGYRVWWRDTTAPQWRHSRYVPANAQPAGSLRLENVVIDDWFFGVSAVSEDGYESPVVFPGDAGAF